MPTLNDALFVIVIFLFFMGLYVMANSSSDTRRRHNEIYISTCKLFLSEYYPALLADYDVGMYHKKYLGGQIVRISLAANGDDGLVIFFDIDLKVNSIDAGDLYVAGLDDSNIRQFKNETLQQI